MLIITKVCKLFLKCKEGLFGSDDIRAEHVDNNDRLTTFYTVAYFRLFLDTMLET